LQKKREERVKVLAKARMRDGSAWSDVCLVNLSSRGAGLQCAAPPSTGSYVEIKRGSNVLIVGRVAWSQGHRFGIRTQDVIWVNAVLNDVAVEQAPTAAVERRAVARTATNHERSRLLARRMQGSFVLAAVACFALLIGSTVQSALARPMALLSTAMAPAEADSN
jgi:hypothetical protein